MKTYCVNTVSTMPDEAAFEKAGYLEIGEYPWGGDYRPGAKASLLKGTDRFYLRMEAAEPRENIRANETGISPAVHEDSCLEFFFCPETGSLTYINLEFNSAGALHIAIGSNRSKRHLRTDVDIRLLNIHTFSRLQENLCHWGICAEIPFSLVAYLLEKPTYQPGETLRGNFYKCGDLTPAPHYAVWNPVVWETPDYHRPECFGTLKIV